MVFLGLRLTRMVLLPDTGTFSVPGHIDCLKTPRKHPISFPQVWKFACDATSLPAPTASTTCLWGSWKATWSCSSGGIHLDTVFTDLCRPVNSARLNYMGMLNRLYSAAEFPGRTLSDVPLRKCQPPPTSLQEGDSYVTRSEIQPHTCLERRESPSIISGKL